MWIINAEDNNDLDFNVCEKVVLILDISDTDFNVCEKVVQILDISDSDFNVCEKVMLILDISDLWGLNNLFNPQKSTQPSLSKGLHINH